MGTQLHLVEPPAKRPGRGGRARATALTTVRSRRAPSWGDWQLDARTRRIGRAGVAAARRVLERARETDGLPRAS